MKQYQKPVMKIIELEELDILTMSCDCPCGCSSNTNSKTYQVYWDTFDSWKNHMLNNHKDYIGSHLDWESYYEKHLADHRPKDKQS